MLEKSELAIHKRSIEGNWQDRVSNTYIENSIVINDNSLVAEKTNHKPVELIIFQVIKTGVKLNQYVLNIQIIPSDILFYYCCFFYLCPLIFR
jgi:hypothetical protein